MGGKGLESAGEVWFEMVWCPGVQHVLGFRNGCVQNIYNEQTCIIAQPEDSPSSEKYIIIITINRFLH